MNSKELGGDRGACTALASESAENRLTASASARASVPSSGSERSSCPRWPARARPRPSLAGRGAAATPAARLRGRAALRRAAARGRPELLHGRNRLPVCAPPPLRETSCGPNPCGPDSCGARPGGPTTMADLLLQTADCETAGDVARKALCLPSRRFCLPSLRVLAKSGARRTLFLRIPSRLGLPARTSSSSRDIVGNIWRSEATLSIPGRDTARRTSTVSCMPSSKSSTEHSSSTGRSSSSVPEKESALRSSASPSARLRRLVSVSDLVDFGDAGIGRSASSGHDFDGDIRLGFCAGALLSLTPNPFSMLKMISVRVLRRLCLASSCQRRTAEQNPPDHVT
mmetsp:Transcript_105062/g.324081  ORF Transcript_105062/g.324081 Transcript_105062/m.324081 type:complete len:342 (-) Transcript_105062:207-1232(-)